MFPFYCCACQNKSNGHQKIPLDFFNSPLHLSSHYPPGCFSPPHPQNPFFPEKNSYNNLMNAPPASASFLLLLLALLTLPSLGKGDCSSSYSLQHSTCTFSYRYNDPNCSAFVFTGCRWSACASWEGEPNRSYCQYYQGVNSTDWAQCTASCCSPDKSYPLQFSSIEECQTDIQQSATNSLILFTTSILGGALLLLSLLLFCCCKERVYSRCACIKGCCEAASHFLLGLLTCRCYARSEEININKFVQNPNTDIGLLSSSWTLPETANEKLNDVCCICLEPRPSLQLQCRHVFHRQCIVASFAKKRECAMCRSKEIAKIKLYCEVCLKTCFETAVDVNRRALGSSQQLACSNCRQTEEKDLPIDLK